MSLRTPLGRILGLGSAKNGTHHWWMQKVTSIALVPLGIWFVVSVVGLIVTGAEYARVVAWLRSPWVAVTMLLFLFTGFYHMQIGLQVIMEDYIHGKIVKTASQVALVFAVFILGFSCVFAVLKLSFGG